jgi:hypothetical protein
MPPCRTLRGRSARAASAEINTEAENRTMERLFCFANLVQHCLAHNRPVASVSRGGYLLIIPSTGNRRIDAVVQNQAIAIWASPCPTNNRSTALGIRQYRPHPCFRSRNRCV